MGMKAVYTGMNVMQVVMPDSIRHPVLSRIPAFVGIRRIK